MALRIKAGPFAEALASISTGSAASLPFGAMKTRSLIAILSEEETDLGSVEHVLRWRLNSSMGPDATSAFSVATASKPSPGLS